METWSLFSINDFTVTAVAAGGLTSVFIVMVTAFDKVDKREREIRRNRN